MKDLCGLIGGTYTAHLYVAASKVTFKKSALKEGRLALW